MSRVVTYGLLIGLGGGLFACAPSIEAQDCAWEFIHDVSFAPTDLGGGYVSEKFDRAGYIGLSDWGVGRTTVEDCQTGDWVQLQSDARREDASYKFDKREEVEAIIAGLGDQEPGTMARYLVAAAEAGDIPYSAGTSDIQSCACAAYYPELRGTKKPYRAET